MPWFRSQQSTIPAGVPVSPTPSNAVIVDGPVAKAKLLDAYDRGRVDERKRHHRSPLLTVVLLLIAIAGAVLIYYAFREGSFAGGGAVVDGKITQVESQAVPAAQTAAAQAGALAEEAGDKLKAQGQAIKQDAPANAQPANP